MSDSALRFERDYEFAPVIVWDALTDADLVSGWLAEATVTPELGGEYSLRWPGRLSQPDTLGRITTLRPLEHLVVDTSTIGTLSFALEELEGGSRGTSTRLRVTIDVAVEPVFATKVRADWLTNLDQLEDLLRGHPVDWSTWETDRHDAWTVHFDEAQNSVG